MLSLQIYKDAAFNDLLADFSGRIAPASGGGGLSFSTGPHGFKALSAPFIPTTLNEAFEVYTWPGTPHVVVSDTTSGVAWEGRLEDIAIVPGGVALTAFGYQRALSDWTYTALWSVTGSADWREVTADDRGSNLNPSLYEMDNNNRIFIAPRQNETFNNASDYGEMTYALPHNGLRGIAKFEATYNITLPADWDVRVLTCDYDFTNVVTEATVTATGSLQTGTWDISTSSKQRIIISVRNNTGSGSSIALDTGERFAKVTGIRIKTTTTSTVTASTIAAALAVHVNAANGNQLSASPALIQTTTTDLQNEIYEDEYHADIMSRLAYLHGYEWGVWEGRVLTFRPRGSSARHWFVDASPSLELQRSLDNVRNNAIGVYRGADGATMRTAAATNADSQERYGIRRRAVVKANTTSATEAAVYRDVYLADHATDQARARVNFDRLYDEVGAAYPLWSIRAGDLVTIRNLPATVSPEIDRIRTFVVAETDYDAAADMVSVSPYEPTPTLDLLIARRGAGV